MSRKEVFICDQCGAQRKEANHWFIGLCSCPGREFPWLSIYTWSEMTADIKDAKHLCGQQCVHKFVDEYMSDATTPS